MPTRDAPVDAVVVGGGAAGLSAALVLGRCLRRTVVVDAGRPRNRFTAEIHAVPTRDGISPRRWLAAVRREVDRYPSVERFADAVTSVRRSGRARLEVGTTRGRSIVCRAVLLATGVVDRLPPLAGVEAFYGTSVFHCPICDGFERHGKRLAAYGKGSHGVALALSLSHWSDDVVLFTHGERLAPVHAARMARARIPVETRRVARLVGRSGTLRRVALEGGGGVPRDALFFATDQRKRDALAVALGCAFGRRGVVRVDHGQRTTVRDVYAAGDVTEGPQLVATGCAEGIRAAIAIHEDLLRLDLAARALAAPPPRRGRLAPRRPYPSRART